MVNGSQSDKEPVLSLMIKGSWHTFSVDTGVSMSSVQSELNLPKSGRTQSLSGFQGQARQYPISEPVDVTFQNESVKHQFVITTGLDCNLMARDLLCAFQLSLECGDEGITVKPWAPRRQCYASTTPQWWTLDLMDQSPSHVTLADDQSGGNMELETFYKRHEGSEWNVVIRALVTGPHGEAEYVEVPPELWKQSPMVAPHITMKVNFPYHAKDLGPMVR